MQSEDLEALRRLFQADQDDTEIERLASALDVLAEHVTAHGWRHGAWHQLVEAVQHDDRPSTALVLHVWANELRKKTVSRS